MRSPGVGSGFMQSFAEARAGVSHCGLPVMIATGRTAMTSFPHGFLWGAATAGHQVEGGNVNADVWPLEWADDSIFAEPSGDACDHYHRYPEDVATRAERGLTAYRLSPQG